MQMKKSIACLLVIGLTHVTALSQENRNMNNYENSVNPETEEKSAEEQPPEQQRTESTKPNTNELQNFYNERRAANTSYPDKSIDTRGQQELDAIVNEMEETNAQSFEYHITTYINSNRSSDKFPNLLQAYSLNPNNRQVILEMASYYEMTGSSKKQMCQKIRNNGYYDSKVYTYASHVLAGVSQNGILLTHGDEDSYPAWVNQELSSQRTDVLVIYTDLLKNDEYASSIYTKLGLGSLSGSTSLDERIDRVITGSSRPVHLALTFRKDFIRKYRSKLYITGLVMRYQPSGEQNLAQAADLWEKELKGAELDKQWPAGVSGGLKRNYIPVLVNVYKHYQQTGKNGKAKEVKKVALAIAVECGIQGIEKYFND